MLIAIILSTLLLILFLTYKKDDKTSRSSIAIPEKWKTILEKNVLFYKNLDKEQRIQFLQDVGVFLSSIKITGIRTEVNLEDRLMVASSAVIPLFGFPTCQYKHLNEVLLYPNAFDRDFNIEDRLETITGMVGSGIMEGKVILSKPALHYGFKNPGDKKNVGLHEFIHLFDKEDGVIDGIPPGYEDKTSSLPWMQFIKKKMSEMIEGESDINPYGLTNDQEFLAVAGEYFFERPTLLKKKHPELYNRLTKIFQLDMAEIIDPKIPLEEKAPSRNSPCPCGSGEKYKRCCIS